MENARMPRAVEDRRVAHKKMLHIEGMEVKRSPSFASISWVIFLATAGNYFVRVVEWETS
jgi:hypothetical protein